MAHARATGRVAWADAARGVAIILVVFGHAAVPALLKDAVYGFHMPLFFFLSGMFFSPGSSLAQFARRRFQTLLVPYFVFGALSVCVWLFRVMYLHDTVYRLQVLASIDDISLLGQFWFLPVLFVVSLLFRWLHGWVPVRWYLVLAVFCALLHSAVQGYATHAWVGTLVHAVNALPFYAFGFAFRQSGREVTMAATCIAAAAFALVFLTGHPLYGLETLGTMDNHFYAYALACCGIIGTIGLCRYASGSRVLTFFGVNSLLVYLLHGYPGALYSRLFAMMGLNTGSLPPGVFGMVQTATCLLLLVPALVLIPRYLPWTLGRSGRRA